MHAERKREREREIVASVNREFFLSILFIKSIIVSDILNTQVANSLKKTDAAIAIPFRSDLGKTRRSCDALVIARNVHIETAVNS